MPLQDHIAEVLRGAPELLQTPQIATGLAVGASQQGPPALAHSVAQSAALAMMLQGAHNVLNGGSDGP